MKIININESQKKRLFEAYDGKFSFAELDKQGDLCNMDFYCYKHLGNSFAEGSSRVVYMLSDNFVLKLAYNKAGIEQNKLEFERYEKTKSKLFPIVYDNGKNFEYIVCENVVPADDVDFDKLARNMSGMNCADMAHVANEAARMAIRADKDVIDQADFEKAFEEMVCGAKSKTKRINEKEKEIVAIHETGHLFANEIYKVNKTKKISILPRGTTLGFVMHANVQCMQLVHYNY